MNQPFQAMLVYLAATSYEPALKIQYLKIELEILRKKFPKRIDVTSQERNRLIKYGKPLGLAIYQLIAIVTPRIFQRWLQAENEPIPKEVADASAKPGRPKTDQRIRDLVPPAADPEHPVRPNCIQCR